MPKPYVFEPGVQYTLKQVGYQILETLAQGDILVQNITEQDGKKVVHHQEMLRQCWREGTLKFVLPGKVNLREDGDTLKTTDGIALKTSYDFSVLSDLPQEIRVITRHRLDLVKRILHLSPRERTKAKVEDLISRYVNELIEQRGEHAITILLGNHIGKGKGPRKKKGVQSPTIAIALLPAEKEADSPARKGKSKETTKSDKPSLTYRTACRWLESFEQSHGDIRSLVPAYHRNGPQRLYLHPDVQEVIKEAIKVVCKENRDPDPMISDICIKVKPLMKEANKERPPKKQLSAPSDRTIYRFIGSLDAEELAELGMRRKRRGPKSDAGDQPPRATRPNERWEFDFCRLDLLVVDAFDRLTIGRPVIAAIRDKYTGYPVAIFISFEPPSYRLVMECLMYAILEKVHVKELFHTANDYLAYGVPETLVVDNGLELHEDLEAACLQLGIELIHTKVRSPWLKGAIERWFRTLSTDLIHRIPGTTFSNFLERGEYASEKEACMTLDALWEALHIWIVDYYTQDKHRGIGPEWADVGIPAQLWKDALEQDFVPALPPSREDLLVLVSRTTERTPEHYGIDFENLVYQSLELKELKERMGQHEAEKHMKWHGQPGKVQVKFYPGDLSRLWVLDPFDLHYFEVKAVSQNYTRGLSLWKHLVIKRFVREELKRKIDEDALLEAKERIQRIVNEEFRLTRRIRSRLGAARWFDHQVVSWRSDSSSGPEDIVPSTSLEMDEDAAGEVTDKADAPPPLPVSTPQIDSAYTAEGISAISASPPPLMQNVSLVPVSGEGQVEMVNPITELPSMPETPAPSKVSTKKQQHQAQEEPSSQTTSEEANTPATFGITVGYDRPFTGEDR
jgi:transposase InsO family protein